MAALVTTYGGKPIVAPALREVPLESNPQAIAFADALIRGQFDVVILLTGVGTRALLDVVGGAGKRDEFVAALAETKVVPRGPKPLSVMRELGLPPWVMVPEPNTWREICHRGTIDKVDRRSRSRPPERSSMAWTWPFRSTASRIPISLKGLEARGARVTSVPVYRWALPDDIEPLRAAVSSVARGEVDVAIFTTGMQVVHLFQVAGMMQQEDAVRAALRGMVVASIGPTTSEELRQQQLTIDLEASHPKMGFLVREAAERAPELLRTRRR